MKINTIRLLLKLKNSALVNKEFTVLEYNRKYISLLNILYTEGFIQSFKVQKNISLNKKHLIVFLRYYHNKSNVKNLKILSTPSLTRYLSLREITFLRDKKFVFFFFNKFWLINKCPM